MRVFWWSILFSPFPWMLRGTLGLTLFFSSEKPQWEESIRNADSLDFLSPPLSARFIDMCGQQGPWGWPLMNILTELLSAVVSRSQVLIQLRVSAVCFWWQDLPEPIPFASYHSWEEASPTVFQVSSSSSLLLSGKAPPVAVPVLLVFSHLRDSDAIELPQEHVSQYLHQVCLYPE